MSNPTVRKIPKEIYARLKKSAKTHARSANLVFSIRNVHKWTNYRGSDPESDYQITDSGTNANETPNEFQTFAAPTYFLFRFNLSF